MAKKTSMGRQKIKMAKIENKNHLQVTFSKRRSGLFKKASELCTLCGVEAAILVFSPAGKVFSFGHPNVEAMVDRFITRNAPPNYNTLQLVEAHRDVSICGLNSYLAQLLNELEAERKTGEMLDRMRKASQSRCWWEAPVDKLGFQELEQLRDSMEELKKNVTNQTNKLLVEATNALPLFAANSSGIVVPFEKKLPIDQSHAGSSTTQVLQSFGYGHGVF